MEFISHFLKEDFALMIVFIFISNLSREDRTTIVCRTVEGTVDVLKYGEKKGGKEREEGQSAKLAPFSDPFPIYLLHIHLNNGLNEAHPGQILAMWLLLAMWLPCGCREHEYRLEYQSPRPPRKANMMGNPSSPLVNPSRSSKFSNRNCRLAGLHWRSAHSE